MSGFFPSDLPALEASAPVKQISHRSKASGVLPGGSTRWIHKYVIAIPPKKHINPIMRPSLQVHFPKYLTMRRLVLITLGVLFSSHLLMAQVDFFPTDTAEFLPKFTSYLTQERNARASEAAEKLQLMWNGGQLSPATESFIQLANAMVESTDADPAMSQLTILLYQLKNDQTKVAIPVNDFLSVTGQCIANLDPKAASYLQSLFTFLPTARPVSKSEYSWEIISSTPSISFETRETLDGAKSARIDFASSDLRYETSRFNDSTRSRGFWEVFSHH